MSESIEAIYERFVEVAKKKNITRLSEWRQGYGILDDAIKRAKKD